MKFNMVIDSSKVKIEGKSKNLGPVCGIVYSASAPVNKKVIWYDTTITQGRPLKYYNLTSKTWVTL